MRGFVVIWIFSMICIALTHCHQDGLERIRRNVPSHFNTDLGKSCWFGPCSLEGRSMGGNLYGKRQARKLMRRQNPSLFYPMRG